MTLNTLQETCIAKPLLSQQRGNYQANTSKRGPDLILEIRLLLTREETHHRVQQQLLYQAQGEAQQQTRGRARQRTRGEVRQQIQEGVQRMAPELQVRQHRDTHQEFLALETLVVLRQQIVDHLLEMENHQHFIASILQSG